MAAYISHKLGKSREGYYEKESIDEFSIIHNVRSKPGFRAGAYAG
jgi:hypothetical protein